MARGIDHLVLAVRDLDQARDTYARLGFTLTPPAVHPWGTRNSLVQLDGAFLELLEVSNRDLIHDAEPGVFSFGAFNRDFLKHGEGMSMLALESVAPEGDRAAFAQAGLAVYAPFSFSRTAMQPDGGAAMVAFDLTYTGHRDISQAAFFTCRNRHPENFWNGAYQRHANGARAISRVILVAHRPAALHEFIQAFAGVREMRATSFGIECRTSRGIIDVMTREGFVGHYGDAYPLGCVKSPRLIGVKLSVDDAAVTEQALSRAGVAFRRSGANLVVASDCAHGTVLIFEQANLS